MTEKPHEKKIITDKLLIEKTDKTLEGWFIVLDKKGAQKMSRPEIFAIASNIKGLEPLRECNQNLLITSYEWNRGLKERGQKESGFEISVSKTVSVPIELLYNSWVNGEQRRKWLKEKTVIRKATENKSARITWSDSKTSISIDFYAKAIDKSLVVVPRLKIPDSKNATELKEFWSKKLNGLKSLLES